MNLQRNLKVKMFIDVHPEDLENEMNKWYKENPVDIKKINYTACALQPRITNQPEYSVIIHYIE